jgi:hypothetical protein
VEEDLIVIVIVEEILKVEVEEEEVLITTDFLRIDLNNLDVVILPIL